MHGKARDRKKDSDPVLRNRGRGLSLEPAEAMGKSLPLPLRAAYVCFAHTPKISITRSYKSTRVHYGEFQASHGGHRLIDATSLNRVF